MRHFPEVKDGEAVGYEDVEFENGRDPRKESMMEFFERGPWTLARRIARYLMRRELATYNNSLNAELKHSQALEDLIEKRRAAVGNMVKLTNIINQQNIIMAEATEEIAQLRLLLDSERALRTA